MNSNHLENGRPAAPKVLFEPASAEQKARTENIIKGLSESLDKGFIRINTEKLKDSVFVSTDYETIFVITRQSKSFPQFGYGVPEGISLPVIKIDFSKPELGRKTPFGILPELFVSQNKTYALQATYFLTENGKTSVETIINKTYNSNSPNIPHFHLHLPDEYHSFDQLEEEDYRRIEDALKVVKKGELKELSKIQAQAK